MSRWWVKLLLVLIHVMGAGVFFSGIGWGLPSRRVDAFLFGEREPWTGVEILQRVGDVGADARGADVDANPIADRTVPVVVNETDARRAEIVRRYRLFSYQPDEMITLMSLARMRPGAGDFDPRLYQYGGLWVYPVGAFLKVCGVLGLIDVRSDLAFYLDYPEKFGRFYIVARAYSAMWGVAGIGAVFWLTRRFVRLDDSQSRGNSDRQFATGFCPVIASLCYICLPVVVNMAHEAKPHLAGAVLMLWACVSALRYAETGRWRWVLVTGALCGAGFGMVLTAVWGFAVIPVMILCRPTRWSTRVGVMLMASTVGLAVYCVTNPYVAWHLLSDRTALQSNLGNSQAMYAIRDLWQATTNGYSLLNIAMGILLPIAAIVSVLRGGRRLTIWILIVPASLVLLQFFTLAAGKPGEYARFALFPAMVCVLLSFAWIARFKTWVAFVLAGFMLISVVPRAAITLLSFVNDCEENTSRLRSAEFAKRVIAGGAKRISIYAEPAPYSLPPINLFDVDLVLVPHGSDPQKSHPPTDTSLFLAEARFSAQPPVWYERAHQVLYGLPLFLDNPIGWADKHFTLVTEARYIKSR